MCRVCKDVFNLRERVSNHDFFEQMREYYNLSSYSNRGRKPRNIKKSILDKIDHNIKELQTKLDKHHYSTAFYALSALKIIPFDAKVTPKHFNEIMSAFYLAEKAEIFACLKEPSSNHG